MTKKSAKKLESFTREKQRQYRKIINPITSELQAALIMYKLKNWHNWQSDTAQLAYDENWKITERRRLDAPKKWAVDILWKIEDINILSIWKNACNRIDQASEIEIDDKERLKKWIQDFIYNEFFLARSKLEKKKHLLHKNFRKFYSSLADSLVKSWQLSNKEWILYRDISLTLASVLYEKNHNYINKDWEITQEWLDYIWRVFLKTIKNIPNSWTSKSFHKIFHDGDFNFLREENSEWEPKIGTLDHYVRIIMYLMDSDSYNAYAEWWQEWANEWYKSKKSFLNNLYATIYLRDENQKWMLSDKWIVHKKFTQKWQSCKDSLQDSVNWDFTWRLKTEASKILKIWWRTKDIKDESWVRATYYWDIEDKQWIKDSILTLCKDYLGKICSIQWVCIRSIQADLKWEFITKEMQWEIIEELWEYMSEIQWEEINISERAKSWTKKSKIDGVSSMYKQLTGKKPRDGLQLAYKIADWEIQRWSNWKYQDFKLIIEYSINKDEYNENLDDNDRPIDEDIDLFQEVSFYPNDNDLGIGNHNFLDLEKKIFNRVKNMNDPQLWKSISLNRLRYFTETALKDLSFDIDIYEDKIRRWLLPKPKNDDYKLLKLDWKELRLDWLVYRTRENTARFDELIPLILNYFMKKNKIFYINKKDENFNGLITSEQLHDKHWYKIRRFTTSDVLRNIALDSKNEDHTISIYTDENRDYWFKNFYMVNLWDLGDFISLEETIKK